MKRLIFCIVAFSPFLGLDSGQCQTATVIESVSDKQTYTFSNASGFSITNNGTVSYDGPLNQIGQSPCCTSATLTVDGVSITVTPEIVQSETKVPAGPANGNTLSPDLVEAEIPVRPSVNQIGLQYDVVIGGVTRIGNSQSYTIQEKVDSQSLSIFPQFSPTVFP